MNQRTEFSSQNVRGFQTLADKYGEMWREVAGRNGQTNYEHNIVKSHVSYYLNLVENLYRFSQQGFEAVMSRVKCIYHKYIARGGHGAEVWSHILQICHFLIRNMLWNSEWPWRGLF